SSPSASSLSDQPAHPGPELTHQAVLVHFAAAKQPAGHFGHRQERKEATVVCQRILPVVTQMVDVQGRTAEAPDFRHAQGGVNPPTVQRAAADINLDAHVRPWGCSTAPHPSLPCDSLSRSSMRQGDTSSRSEPNTSQWPSLNAGILRSVRAGRVIITTAPLPDSVPRSSAPDRPGFSATRQAAQSWSEGRLAGSALTARKRTPTP